MWLLCLLAHLLMARGGQVWLTALLHGLLAFEWTNDFLKQKISPVTVVWTWIPAACSVCAISNETSYHVHTFLFSLTKHSAHPVILPSLKASISLWRRSMWCVGSVRSESSSSPVQMPSPSCFIFQPKQKDWCTNPNLILGLFPQQFLQVSASHYKLWSFYPLPCCACGSSFTTKVAVSSLWFASDFWRLSAPFASDRRFPPGQCSSACEEFLWASPAAFLYPSCAPSVQSGVWWPSLIFFQMLENPSPCDACFSVCMVSWGLGHQTLYMPLCHECLK